MMASHHAAARSHTHARRRLIRTLWFGRGSDRWRRLNGPGQIRRGAAGKTWSNYQEQKEKEMFDQWLSPFYGKLSPSKVGIQV
jgi:hypothetical protein